MLLGQGAQPLIEIASPSAPAGILRAELIRVRKCGSQRQWGDYTGQRPDADTSCTLVRVSARSVT